MFRVRESRKHACTAVCDRTPMFRVRRYRDRSVGTGRWCGGSCFRNLLDVGCTLFVHRRSFWRGDTICASKVWLEFWVKDGMDVVVLCLFG
jgi:hypothetical protein